MKNVDTLTYHSEIATENKQKHVYFKIYIYIVNTTARNIHFDLLIKKH